MVQWHIEHQEGVVEGRCVPCLCAVKPQEPSRLDKLQSHLNEPYQQCHAPWHPPMSHDELVIEPGRDFEVENALDGTNTDFDPLMAAPPGSTIMLCGAAPPTMGCIAMPVATGAASAGACIGLGIGPGIACIT